MPIPDNAVANVDEVIQFLETVTREAQALQIRCLGDAMLPSQVVVKGVAQQAGQALARIRDHRTFVTKGVASAQRSL